MPNSSPVSLVRICSPRLRKIKWPPTVPRVGYFFLKAKIPFRQIVFKKKNEEIKREKKVRVAKKVELKKLQELYSTSEKLKDGVKLLLVKEIESKKIGLKKLQDLYSDPKKLPGEVKLLLAKKIESKKNELKQLYSEPNDAVKLGKVQKWAGLQVVKAMFGIPIVPGK